MVTFPKISLLSETKMEHTFPHKKQLKFATVRPFADHVQAISGHYNLSIYEGVLISS